MLVLKEGRRALQRGGLLRALSSSWSAQKSSSLLSNGEVTGRMYSAEAVTNDADYEKFMSDSSRSHVTVRSVVDLCGWF